jgi:molybdopterin-guanine dinucleotide biosynthesis protein
MQIVIVGGPHSGVGKTLACERALQALAGQRFGAIKLTVADGEFDTTPDHGASALNVADAAGICGRGASCGVCETVSARVPSRAVTATGAILKPGTDTWRLANAGAVAVAWIITLRDAAPAAIDGAVRHLADRGAQNVLIEGTTALDWMQPSASIMVATDPGRKWKDVALRRIATCDIVLRNKLPLPCGDQPAPGALADAHPLDCDLSRSDDQGTSEFQRRLLELTAALNVERARAR